MQAIALTGLYQAYLTDYRGRAGLLVSERSLQEVEHHATQLVLFLQHQRWEDIKAAGFQAEHATQFLAWLISAQHYQLSTAAKHVTRVQQVLQWGAERELLAVSPLINYTCARAQTTELVCLSSEELQHLTTLPLKVPSLARVRDNFVLQCWTGLSYADLVNLNVAAQQTLHNQHRLLRVRRAKNTMFRGYECQVPLLPEAERILARYQDVLSIPTNQVYNRYLKRIAELSGLSELCLTAQVGRNTAGLQLLQAGVPLACVTKILGHSSKHYTQRTYAPYLDTALLEHNQEQVQQAYGLGKPSKPTIAPEEVRRHLGKLRIVFGFVKRPLGRAQYQALCAQLGVECLEPEQVGRLRVTIEILGRDQHRFHTSISVTRPCWDFQKQRASGPGSESINQQVAAFIGLQYKLFIDLIERRKPLTAWALVRAYRSQKK